MLKMPEVAAAATEAILSDWLLAEGASFAVGDALATVETEKALVDLEADTDGVMVKLLVGAGDTVAVGSPIALLGSPGEQIDDVGAVLASLGVDDSPGEAAPAPEQSADTETAPEPERSPEPAVASQQGRIFSSPLARKIAAAAGLSLTQIDGTGPRNRILRRDVERALADADAVSEAPAAAPAAPASAAAPAPAAPAPAAPESAPVAPAPSLAGTSVPHSRLRRAVAARLQQSKQEAPHFYLRATVRVDRLLAMRREINEGAVRVSVNDLVVKAAAAAHALVPEMNCTWTDEAVVFASTVDVAVAVAGDAGLLTPVVRGVDGLSVTQLAASVGDLATRARSGKLRQAELEGGTLTVTNLGMFGVEEFAAIINPPHAAILAVGASREEPVVVDGGVGVGSVMTVTLSVDHRPVDGVVAATWLAAFVELVEHPLRILA